MWLISWKNCLESNLKCLYPGIQSQNFKIIIQNINNTYICTLLLFYVAIFHSSSCQHCGVHNKLSQIVIVVMFVCAYVCSWCILSGGHTKRKYLYLFCRGNNNFLLHRVAFRCPTACQPQGQTNRANNLLVSCWF